ncbi:PREDICTED: WD repeat-containing protein 76-like [Camelina sativa]|uniref:WD repeat-containing protein 76-like n=1 Tax=Camelina sativa TaxID=90675 RepID=A0ABM0WLQ2_CAMSA|nr:PREDICTED: WD repeat-containing protein 76-like [Camelina sativa]
MATEYERKRLENIRRNDEMMAALNVRAKASLLVAPTKSTREDVKKSTKPTTVIRESKRTRGLTPDSAGLPFNHKRTHNTRPLHKASSTPMPFDVAYEGEDDSLTQFVDTLLGIISRGTGAVKDDNESPPPMVMRSRTSSIGVVNNRDEADLPTGFDLESLSLEPHNVARVVPGRVLVAKFLPCLDVKMIAAGGAHGSVGFWNLDCQGDDDDDGIYLFTPHTNVVTSLVFQQNSFYRVITSSYDGLIRVMDVEKLVFDSVCSRDESIYSLSQRPNDEQSLFFSEGNGMFNLWDLRAGKSVFHWELHELRINSVDFNPQNPHIMATSSSDGTACLWDLRSMGAPKPKTLTTVNHSRAVDSAYFSPSGLLLATTSCDNNVGILSGRNFEDTSMIYHKNSTLRNICNFRGVWGWDDSCIIIGNMSKGIDVISPERKRIAMSLQSPLMKSIPSRINCHPLNVGTLAGSTAGGEVYVWTAN